MQGGRCQGVSARWGNKRERAENDREGRREREKERDGSNQQPRAPTSNRQSMAISHQQSREPLVQLRHRGGHDGHVGHGRGPREAGGIAPAPIADVVGPADAPLAGAQAVLRIDDMTCLLLGCRAL